MLKQFFLTYIRLAKRKLLFTIILFFSLGISLSASYVCYTIARHELDYETENTNNEEIYRVTRHETRNGELITHSAVSFPVLAKTLTSNFPEVKLAGRMMKRQGVLRYKDHFFNEYFIFNADDDMIDILNISITSGNVKNPIKEPNTAIISERYAKKYFGADDPLDKIITLNEETYRITGVFKDYPSNSHLKFEVLLSYSTFSSTKRFEESWSWNNFYTYVQLQPGSKKSDLEDKVTSFLKDKQENMKKDPAVKTYLTFFEVRDIHLTSELSDEINATSDYQTVYLLFMTASVLLLISLLNYSNIIVANNIEKVKEIQIRKIFGAERKSIFLQGIIESLITSIITIFIGFTILTIFFAFFEDKVALSIDKSILFNPIYLLSFVTIYILSFIVVSFTGFSSLFTSSFQNYKISGFSSGVSRSILVLQMVAALIVCSFTLGLIQQFNFLKQSELGFNPDDVLVIDPPNLTDSLYENKLTVFKESIKSYAKISDLTIASSIPGEPILDFYENSIRKKDNEIVNDKMYFILIDENYFKTFGITLTSGRTIDLSNPADEGNVVVNEKAAHLLGYSNSDDAIGGIVNYKKGYFTIVGVVRDYHHESLKKAIDPIIFQLNTDLWGFFCVNGEVHNSEVMSYVKNKWTALVPDSPFDYSFLTDRYEIQYRNEVTLYHAFTIFSAIAIFMIALGLFGVVSLTIKRQLKSLALKRVMGASLTNLAFNSARQFFLLSFLAVIPSVVISRYIITMWLSNQAHRVDIKFDIFVFPIIMLITIIIGNIFFHVTTSLKNLMSVIRNE